MSTLETNNSGRIAGTTSGDDRSCLELLLRLQPFPCLVVETHTARIVLTNDEARRTFSALHGHGTGPSDSYATDAWGRRVEVEQVLPLVVGSDLDGDGVELTWHTPVHRRVFRVASRALPDREGRNPLAMVTFLDLTGQRTAEGELREAVEARDEFFSVATHELKDPLFSLQLSIQLLRLSAERQGPIPGHVLQHLDVSERQVTRLGRLIDNMLDVARIANGRIDLDVETVDLCELAHQVVGRFHGQANSAGIPMVVEPCHPVVASFDRLKMEQVIGNLLSNAIKYGEGNPVVVRVRGEEELAVLEVEDGGPGIAPEDQERVFSRFERASTGHKKASLGLGLYIVRSLVHAHGGSIGLRSEPGLGSIFTVKIPRQRPGKEA